MKHSFAYSPMIHPDAAYPAASDKATEVKRLVNKKLRFEDTVAVFGQSPPGGY